jgi:hypothetical protein
MLKEKDIIQAIKDLAKSQGFYGRLLASIQELDEPSYNALMRKLEDEKFVDVVDMILYFEQ